MRQLNSAYKKGVFEVILANKCFTMFDICKFKHYIYKYKCLSVIETRKLYRNVKL